jgi:hypothetical protein
MPNITFTQQNRAISFELIASDDGEVLAFKGAILARAETNLNSDDIDTAGITELASSLVGRPVDVEHDTGANCGVFTKAEPVEGSTALSVDGFVWADRYPEQARGMQAGTHALSVEATANTAICSICNKSFEDAQAYCDHLNNRKIYGAVRKLRGLHGKGGAVTTRPAGTNTNFNPVQVYFVASHLEMNASWYDKYLKDGETLKDLPDSDFADPEGRRFPYKIHGDVKEEGWRAAWSAANGGHTGTKDAKAVAKLKRDKPSGIEIKESQEATMKKEKVEEVKAEEVKPEIQAEVVAVKAEEVPVVEAAKPAEGSPEEEKKESKDEEKKEDEKGEGDALKAQVDEMAKCMGEMQASVATILETIKGIQSLQVEQKVMARRAVLKGSLSDEVWEKEKDTIMGMDEKAFYLFASTRQPSNRLTLAAGVSLPDTHVAGGTKEPLTLKRS